jgi:mRNA interferase MazF
VNSPRQRDVWFADLEPVIGHEQGRRRPVVIVSRDALGRTGLVVAVPLTTRDVGSPLHLRLEPPEGGLREVSFALPQHVRALSTQRWSSDRAPSPPTRTRRSYAESTSSTDPTSAGEPETAADHHPSAKRSAPR